MHSYTIEEARKIVMKCAKVYNDTLVNKKYIVIFRDKLDNQIKFFEICFSKENYQHMTGIELVDRDGNVNFCLGIVLDSNYNYYVPVSSLLEDIKKLTNKPSQVLAILSKDKSDRVYEKIRHVAKGVNLNNLNFSKEIKALISLENYIPKKQL